MAGDTGNYDGLSDDDTRRKGNRAGRQRRFTDRELRGAIVECAGSVSDIARLFGVGAQRVYRRIQASPAVREALDDQRTLVVDKTLKRVFEKAEAGDQWAMSRVLDLFGYLIGAAPHVDQPAESGARYFLAEGTNPVDAARASLAEE